MPSQNKTPYLKLHNWQPNEHVSFMDIAADNLIIDEAIQHLRENGISEESVRAMFRQLNLEERFDSKVDKLEGYSLISVEEKSKIQEHIESKITEESGVHGFRYFNEILQVYNTETSEWTDITLGGGMAPSDVTNLMVKIGSGRLTISWKDPDDTILDGKKIVTWKGTKLVQKVGAFPEDINDGILVVDNQERNKYETNGFVINNLSNGIMYYFQLFPYSDKNAVNKNINNRLSAEPESFKIMTVKVDLNNSNPESCVSYHDDAVEMSPGHPGWDEFFGFYPCVLKNGKEIGRLKKTDFTKFENNSDAEITSGNAGDVMIAFPRRGVKISTSDNILTVSITNEPDNSNFKYYAHTKGNLRKDVFYLGAYKGFFDGSQLRSLNGKIPTANKSIETFRTYAKNNGDGYEQLAFYQFTFIQAMYLLKYKHLNCQEALGLGYVNSNNSPIVTGGTNLKGMYFGESTGKLQMKIFGLEDFWGNLLEFVDGVYLDGARNILTATENFNSTGLGYHNHGQAATADVISYMKKPQGNTEMGFIMKENQGSSTTYFCDYATIRSNGLACTGSHYELGIFGGIFYLCIEYSATESSKYISARLMYI